ncbi:fumarylacetoacetate hydrolase family protein [Haloarcula marina]|uniref:fumarylacetoacetate hydrolase family protein n=1 Tax=Haloarcula marina TaxID=2961574 RepID=UPI0020B7CF4D|nr:fumarylacetoacetate hydrolase family protein [Halomicroarcula marina]
MRYYQSTLENERHLLAKTENATYDLTNWNDDIDSFGTLLRAADDEGVTPDTYVEESLEEANAVEAVPGTLSVPIVADEIWAAGVTYRISEEAREAESESPDIYMNVYDAERPEIFFKSTPSRTVGPNDAVGIRSDSEWDVPEPELGIVLYQGDIVGYTIGNDMSSRSIEGENPLYLPQAKVYDRCCSIGPCVATVGTIEDPHDLDMNMSITRDGEVLYNDGTSTSEMVRSCEELVSYYTRHNNVPEFSVLLTGTSLVPEENFTLEKGDQIHIDIEGIGTLENEVIPV